MPAPRSALLPFPGAEELPVDWLPVAPARSAPSSAHLWLISAASWLLFFLLFPLIVGHLGLVGNVVALVLTALLTWLGGLRYGLLQATLGLPTVTAGYLFYFHTLDLLSVLIGLVAAVAISLIVGRVQALHARLLAQQELLLYLAQHDPLTGLYNRRTFTLAFARLLEDARTSGTPLSVALLDIDHFKRVNDQHSHLTGDAVLRAVAGVLRAGVGPGDVLARYGGEEFVVCFPNLELNAAVERCEVLRRAVEAHDWSEWVTDPGFTVTLSVGVCGGAQASTEHLLSRADALLYAAKREGRNRVAYTLGAPH